MTQQLIEVRATSEQYDVQAQWLAREILQLPPHTIFSPEMLESLSQFAPPSLTFSTAHLYRLSGTLDDTQRDILIAQLLVDPVIQTAQLVEQGENETASHIVDVFFHPGVTDTLAESIITGAQMLGIFDIESAETGRRYFLDGRLSRDALHIITQSFLYNPVIQYYAVLPVGTQHDTPEKVEFITPPPLPVQSIALTQMSDAELLDLSRAGLLSFNLDELHAIQRYYRELGREPTDVELETLAQTWSEHCSHKTFKATIEYSEIDSDGNLAEQETISGLLKRYIMRATEQVRPDWLVSAFSDNAGIVRFTQTHDIAFKVETHNHPSAIEPFGGANTGVGGVIRDVLGVSAQPIACTDILCFGPPDTRNEELPQGVLPPRRITSGVVDGVRDYGNKMGIPTVNGAILYHPGYIYNPLVFCGCLGLLPHGSHPHEAQPGDAIVVLGGRTGRDGIHGATFSSGEMSVEINTQAGAAVQIGAPITEKKVTDVILQARDRHLYSAITDCGAGGFSSAIGEMGADTGVRVELAKAPLKYQGLAPWEIWLSEAQERMVLAVPPAHLDELLELCTLEEVEASILGTFTDDHHLTITYNGQTVADLDMDFLHEGRPNRILEASWTRPDTRTSFGSSNLTSVTLDWAHTLQQLLHHPTIASKDSVVRRYDHEVQGATVLKPLAGDAAVLCPLMEEAIVERRFITSAKQGAARAINRRSTIDDVREQATAGIVLSNGVNPLYGRIDPYHMAINAVDEALRNLTAVGGDITRASLLDNFCWGNPTDPRQLGMLVRAVKGCYDAAVGFGTPFISGKDSLNNEYRVDGTRLQVIPTLLISAVGVIDDATQTVDMPLKTPGNQRPGNLLYLVGKTHNELAGSHYLEVTDTVEVSFETYVPRVDIAHSYATMKALSEAIRAGMVRACHDVSEGGLAVALAEMAIMGKIGVTLNLARISVTDIPDIPAIPEGRRHDILNTIRLFSESASRFIVEITHEQAEAFEQHMHDVTDLTYIGEVGTDNFTVRDEETELFSLPIFALEKAWRGEQE